VSEGDGGEEKIKVERWRAPTAVTKEAEEEQVPVSGEGLGERREPGDDG